MGSKQLKNTKKKKTETLHPVLSQGNFNIPLTNITLLSLDNTKPKLNFVNVLTHISCNAMPFFPSNSAHVLHKHTIKNHIYSLPFAPDILPSIEN